MDDTQDVRAPRAIVASDIDANGNVKLYDHGPQEPPEAVDAWHKQNGDLPVVVLLNATDAAHALDVDPVRYSLEPANIDEDEIAAEVKVIQDQRAEAEKVAAQRAADMQLTADRKTAIGTITARHVAEYEAEKAKKPAPAPAPPDPALQPQPSANAARITEIDAELAKTNLTDEERAAFVHERNQLTGTST